MSKLGVLGWDKHSSAVGKGLGWVEMTQAGPAASGNVPIEDDT